MKVERSKRKIKRLKDRKKGNKPMTNRSGAGKNEAGLTGQKERLIQGVGAITREGSSNNCKGQKEEEQGCWHILEAFCLIFNLEGILPLLSNP